MPARWLIPLRATNMPILNDFRKTKIISLPSFPESKVEIFDSLLVGDLAAFDYKNSNLLQLSLEVLPRLIKSWNFTDEKGNAMPIVQENLNFLKEADVKYLIEQITEFNQEVKKN